MDDGRVSHGAEVDRGGPAALTTRRGFLHGAARLAAMPLLVKEQLRAAEAPAGATARRKPNLILLFSDDQGYQDLGCFGSKDIRTPRIDRMAGEGTRCTSFYAQPVCGPSRCALMTGCYPMRADSVRRGRDPGGRLGKYDVGWTLHPDEITIAEVLKAAGYATGCFGKWDLSGRETIKERLPLNQGFDVWVGDPGCSGEWKGTPGAPPEARKGVSSTHMLTDRAIDFIRKHRDRSFFAYLPYHGTHGGALGRGSGEPFRGKPRRGPYGAAVEEMDFNVGRILDALKAQGIGQDTVVLFTSDNGPWVHLGRERAGSTGPLKGGKGSPWEGGLRVPCVVWGPGRIPAGQVRDGILSTLDVLPTFARMAGARLPGDRVIDGCDQTAYITGRSEKSAREVFCYYVGSRLLAVRRGRWKLFLPYRREAVFGYAPWGYPMAKPQLYDLESDISEKTDLAAEHPRVVADMMKLAEQVRADLGDNRRNGKGCRHFKTTSQRTARRRWNGASGRLGLTVAR